MDERRLKAVGLGVVLVIHALALWGLWRHRLIPAPTEALTLFVNFVAPPVPEASAPKPEPAPPKPRPVEKPQPRQLVAQAPVQAPTEYVAPPPPPPAPVIEAPAPAMPLPAGPVNLGSELSAACAERTAPSYPFLSRRNNEEGTVVLRVELSESGHVAAARVQSSSGHVRLDEAALTAVRTWRCTPAQRNGQPVRASALQPFRFVLQGN